jgi:hypothetical protein
MSAADVAVLAALDEPELLHAATTTTMAASETMSRDRMDFLLHTADLGHRQ